MTNQDFKLCADGGLQDHVRRFTSGYKTETLRTIRDAFARYLAIGRLTFSPNIAGLFAEVYNPTVSLEENKHNIEAAIGALDSIIIKETEQPA